MLPAMKVIFFLAIILPGQHHEFRSQEQVDSLASCFLIQMEFLARAARRALKDGREFSAGCSVEVAPAKEG